MKKLFELPEILTLSGNPVTEEYLSGVGDAVGEACVAGCLCGCENGCNPGTGKDTPME